MTVAFQKILPGSDALPKDLLALADEYRGAADILRSSGRRGQPISRAPYRMVAIHAIELYLNATLLTAGYTSTQIRGMHHNLCERTEIIAKSIAFRRRTIDHLVWLSLNREFLGSRYHPTATETSQINRLEATMNEVAAKTTKWIVAQSINLP